MHRNARQPKQRITATDRCREPVRVRASCLVLNVEARTATAEVLRGAPQGVSMVTLQGGQTISSSWQLFSTQQRRNVNVSEVQALQVGRTAPVARDSERKVATEHRSRWA